MEDIETEIRFKNKNMFRLWNISKYVLQTTILYLSKR